MDGIICALRLRAIRIGCDIVVGLCTLGTDLVSGGVVMHLFCWIICCSVCWMSWCSSLYSWLDLLLIMPFSASLQLASACIILSAGVMVGLVMCLCLNWIVSVNRSLLVSLM